MRYFEDGDLTEGLKIAQKPYPIDLIEGSWHIVWACIDGSTRTIDYDEPAALSVMGFTLQQIEPSDKRKKSINDLMSAELSFCQWGLEYEGIYNTEGLATTFELKANTTPSAVEADDEAFLAFGAVVDDYGFPFLQFSTSASPMDAGLDHLQSMEFVAKKTDPTGIQCLELTKNEKLRLGYAVRADGSFEDVASSAGMAKGDTYESLTKQLQDHTDAQARILEKISKIRENMDRQLRDIGIAGQRVVSLTPHTGPTATNTINTTTSNNNINSNKHKRSSSSQHHSTTRQPRHSAQEVVNTVLGAPTRSAEAFSRSNSSATSTQVSGVSPTSSSATSGGRGGGGGGHTYRKKLCKVCNTSVSVQNWAVHEKTNKHKHNIAGEGELDSVDETAGPRPTKRRRRTTTTTTTTAAAAAAAGAAPTTATPTNNGATDERRTEGKLARPGAGSRRSGDMALRAGSSGGRAEMGTPNSM